MQPNLQGQEENQYEILGELSLPVFDLALHDKKLAQRSSDEGTGPADTLIEDGVPLHQSQCGIEAERLRIQIPITEPSTSRTVEAPTQSDKVFQLKSHPQAPGAFAVDHKKIPGAELTIIERGNLCS